MNILFNYNIINCGEIIILLIDILSCIHEITTKRKQVLIKIILPRDLIKYKNTIGITIIRNYNNS